MISEIVVRELDSTEYDLWNKMVEKSPYGTIFHTSDWLTICKDSFNLDLNIYGCFENGELVGGCSLFIKKLKGGFNIALSTCNMTPYGGILVKKSPSTKVRKQELFQNNILKNILKYINDQGFDRVSISNSPDFIDTRQFSSDNWITDIKYAYYFDLSGNIEETISNNVKRAVRKATENEIQTKKENDPQLFYALFKETFERQSLTPPAQMELFENVLTFLNASHKGEMWIAEMPTGEAAAAEIIIWDNKRAYRWAAAANNELRHLNPTSLLVYNIIQDLKSRNYTEINLMGANTPNITEFITGFNPKLVPYYLLNCNSQRYRLLKRLYIFIKLHIH